MLLPMGPGLRLVAGSEGKEPRCWLSLCLCVLPPPPWSNPGLRWTASGNRMGQGFGLDLADSHLSESCHDLSSVEYTHGISSSSVRTWVLLDQYTTLMTCTALCTRTSGQVARWWGSADLALHLVWSRACTEKMAQFFQFSYKSCVLTLLCSSHPPCSLDSEEGLDLISPKVLPSLDLLWVWVSQTPYIWDGILRSGEGQPRGVSTATVVP